MRDLQADISKVSYRSKPPSLASRDLALCCRLCRCIACANGPHYEVHWYYCADADNSVEPLGHLTGSADIIRAFEETL